MSSIHISARPGEVAETILLPGDPLRAQFIANHFLTNVQPFNQVRNMLGFTGEYQGKRVSVMGTGMGIPSVSIYAHELIDIYGVKNLIRVGSAGAMQEHVRVRDLVIVQAASTDASFGQQYGTGGTLAAVSDFGLLEKALKTAREKQFRHHVGHILSSDIFYHEDPELWKKWKNVGVLCVEMEAYALLLIAARKGVSALTLATISDSLVSGEQLSQEERQLSFTEMTEVALSTVL